MAVETDKIQSVNVHAITPSDDGYYVDLVNAQTGDEMERVELWPNFGRHVLDSYYGALGDDKDVMQIDGTIVDYNGQPRFDWDTFDEENVRGLTFAEEQEEIARNREEFLANDPLIESPFATIAKTVIAETEDELAR